MLCAVLCTTVLHNDVHTQYAQFFQAIVGLGLSYDNLHVFVKSLI